MSQLIAAIMTTVFALGAATLPFSIEQVGRRRVLMYSAAMMAVCLSIFVAMIGSPHRTLAKQWTAIAALICYNYIFGYGWIGVCWLYGPEVRDRSRSYENGAKGGTQIAPLKLRHVAGASGAFGEWLLSFVTVFAGGIGLQQVGWKLWIWPIISCAIAVPFVWFMCPETTGKTLEEIDMLFQDASSTNSTASDDNTPSFGENSEKAHTEQVESV